MNQINETLLSTSQSFSPQVLSLIFLVKVCIVPLLKEIVEGKRNDFNLDLEWGYLFEAFLDTKFKSTYVKVHEKLLFYQVSEGT